MDKNRFDGFTRKLAHRENRRQALKTLLAGGLGTAAAVVVGGEAEAAKTDCCPETAPTLCDLTCTDTINSSQNCGGCGVTCDEGEQCYRSVCESGSILHCEVAADCPGTDTDCFKRTCTQGVCGTSNVPYGTKISASPFCFSYVCDGLGNVITVVDDTSTPEDVPCMISGCQNGQPTFTPVRNGKKCGDGGRCSNGICRDQNRCGTASDCQGTDNACQSRTCIDRI